MKILSLLLGAMLLGGCCSAVITQKGDRDLIVVKNEGLKLFNCIPLFSGDPNYPNQEVANWFEDTVTLKTNMLLLDNAMTEHGYHGYRELTSYKDDETIFPLLFKRYVYHTSAELLK